MMWLTPPASSLLRQRIAKSGTQQVTRLTRTQVTSWVSDATYPGTVDSNGLQVDGAGAATVTATISRLTNIPTATTSTFSVYLMRNGVEAAAQSDTTGNTTTVAWAGAIADGDHFTIEVWSDIGAAQGNPRTVTAASFLEVVPD